MLERPCQAWINAVHGCEFIVLTCAFCIHLYALMTVHVKGPYAVLNESSTLSAVLVLSLRLAILAHAFHLQSIPIELFMKGK